MRRKMAQAPAPVLLCSPGQTNLKRALHTIDTRRWPSGQRHGHDRAPNSGSSATSSCWGATLAPVRTTPSLLRNRPSSHPIGEPSIAIIGLRRRHATSALVRAALAVNSTAPLLLRNGPACLPVCETILAIVGVRGCWGLGGLATDVVDPAAPLLLSLIPCEVLADCAIVWVNGSTWSWRSGRSGRRGHSGWRRGRRRGEWCWRDRECSLRQGRGRATPAHSRTAVVFLRLGPRPLDELITTLQTHACLTIVRQRRGQTREQPEQQRYQQQETRNADDASEISPWPHHIEVSAVPDVLVGGFLDVLSLAGANVRQGATSCATSATNTASSALLAWPNTAGTAVSCSTTSSSGVPAVSSRNHSAVPTGWPCNHTTIAATCSSHPGYARSATIRAIHVCERAS